jgi:low affinity Fe/Cu permease
MNRIFSCAAQWTAKQSGRAHTFIGAILVIVLWAATGPLFGFSDTWQLIINTGTTIVTFLMVFLIQNTQNRDGAAIQAKLDELIRTGAAQDRYIGIENLTEQELNELKERCAARAKTDVAEDIRRAADEAETAANERAARAAERAAGVI